MPRIRQFALAASAILLALALSSPSSARPCKDGEAACTSETQTAPMKLNQFMKTWKPVSSTKKRAKKAKPARSQEPAVQEAASEPARETAEKTDPPATEDVSEYAAVPTPMPAPETDGVAVTSFSELNELDATAGKVQVVAFNEVNAIDLAAPPAPPAPAAPPESVGQSVAPAEPADHSWIGKLLLAAAGTIAVAGATRLLVA